MLFEDSKKWFELDKESPYMLFVSEIVKEKKFEITEKDKELFGIDLLNIKKSEIPAVTHVDYSSRIQTVKEETNKLFYNLIKKFKKETDALFL